MMQTYKPAVKSVTIQASTIGAIVSLIVLGLSLFGVTVDEATLTTAAGALITLITSIVAIVGRLRATKQIA